MKLKIILIALLAAFLGGCAAHGHGTHRLIIGSVPKVLAHNNAPRNIVTPPARVFHGGKWLHYRSNAYYYRHGSIWIIAPSVPSNVAHHHRVNQSNHNSNQSEQTARRDRTDHRNTRSNNNSRHRRQH